MTLGTMDIEAIAWLTGVMLLPVTDFCVRKVLVNPKYNRACFTFAGILAVVGLTQINNHDPGKPNFYLFLGWPLCSLCFYKLFLYIFQRALHRNPKIYMQVPWNLLLEEDGMGWDRFFNFFVLIICIATPAWILAYFYP